MAQSAVERNLPPAPTPAPAPIAEANIVPASQDDTPLGPDLRAIVLLGSDDAVLATAEAGVDATRVPMLGGDSLAGSLAQFIGRPLSRKLIAQIETRIARHARGIGRPFISLSTPEQEITGGVLQIRVTEFHAGQISVDGVDGKAADAVRNAVRLEPGEPVDSHRLAEDLDWLNRRPFDQVQARFAPAADQTGVTDLSLVVDHRRPLRIYGGWSNGGSKSTGRDRFFLGGMAGLPMLDGAYASYQITGSRDFWYDDGDLLRSEPRYVSHGLRLYLPTFARQDVELTVSDALTNQAIDQNFSVRQRTTEFTVGYRSALSNLGLPAGSGDMLVGVEFKRQRRDVFFGELTALSDTADIWQGMAGLSKYWLGNGQQASASLNVHVSPGGISTRSAPNRLATISNNRVTSDRYAYATLDLTGAVRLPGNLALSSQLSLQYTGRPLPLPAQFGIGGDGLVRGYSADDGSFDRGFVMRNELRLPPVRAVGRASNAVNDQLTPYAFVDLAKGWDIAADSSTAAASAGVGANYRIGRTLSAGFDSAWALKDSIGTRAGDWHLHARVTFTF